MLRLLVPPLSAAASNADVGGLLLGQQDQASQSSTLQQEGRKEEKSL